MTLDHRASHGPEIRGAGFRDATSGYGFGVVTGCWIVGRRAEHMERAQGDHLLVADSTSITRKWSRKARHREWVVPADVLNRWAAQSAAGGRLSDPRTPICTSGLGTQRS